MNNAYRGDIDVFETMLKFALKVPTKHANLKLPGFPHEFDLFVPSSTPRFGIVFHTGGGGTKNGAEESLGSSAEWAEEHRVVVAVPQGQSITFMSMSFALRIAAIQWRMLLLCTHVPCLAVIFAIVVFSVYFLFFFLSRAMVFK